VIRSLLIDNYDSYTYNLFNLMAQVNGIDPIVRRNDDPRCPADLAEVDCVVVSPGPGDPRRSADFGLCAEVLETARVPILGVCLGHQGIGRLLGADVTRAPAARHGFVSKIRHTGGELFAGIPQDFSGVRYHSLCVTEPLPDTLEPLAWAEDGVLMALRCRDRPLWGVQFHPESVLTQYGAKLLGNFRDIVRSHHGLPAPTKRHYVAHLRTLDTLVPGEVAFQRLFGASDRAAWLDSAAKGPGSGRFSYLAHASQALGEKLTYRRTEGSVRVEAAGRVRTVPGTLFDVLEDELARRDVVAPEVPFDFTGGYVGFLGYELKADLGATARHASDLPDAQWIFADRLVVLDHDEGVTHLVALTDGPATTAAAMSWLDRAAADLLAARRTVPPPGSDPLPADPSPGSFPLSPDPRLHALAESALDRDLGGYRADIATIMNKLLAGETYEVCLTTTLRLPRPVASYAFYRMLRRRNPAPYAAYLSFGAVEVACSSPERFLKITRDRVVEAKPIKGTAARVHDPADDRRVRAGLSGSAKTVAENLMIVDLLRNDLSRVCAPGSVHVPALMRVESYATVHQLVSTIRGRLRSHESVVSCIRACFPGGSMTGAPKHRTMEIIDELEHAPRGIYSGAIGFLACNGTADLNIVIRTAVFTADEVRIGAGGAIVLDSDPEDECEEMLLKAMAPLGAYRAVAPEPVLAPAAPEPGGLR
jgi:para-aminobenzoate synthetase